MAVLVASTPTPAGATPTFAAGASGGDRSPVGDNVYLHFKNTSGGSITVTVDSVTPCNYGSDHDLSVAVPATTGEKIVGPLPASRFASASDGLAAVTYSANPPTGLTVAVITR